MFNKNFIQITLNCITVSLVLTTGFLVYKNRALKQKLADAPIYATESGFKFTELDMHDLDGNVVQLSFGGQEQKTLLLNFSTACEYCTQEYPYWRELIAKLDPHKWRVIGITRQTDSEAIKTHLASYGLQDLKVLSIKAEDAAKCRMGYTPMVIKISETGEVDKVWTGLWKPSDIPSIFQNFS